MTTISINNKEYTINESAVSDWMLLTLAKLAQQPADFALQRQVAELLAEVVFLDADDAIAVKGVTNDKWFLTVPIAALGDLVTVLSEIYLENNPDAEKNVSSIIRDNNRDRMRRVELIETPKKNRGFERK